MHKFEVEYKKLNAGQKQAVDTIDGPVLVIAGPGTGKTQLLSLRVANILRTTDTNPNNILCLTYTESGQSAMLQRLTSLLGKEAKRLEIHTFHGFGTHLINRFNEYFTDLTNFRPADDLALYETLLSCFEQLSRNNPLSKMAYGQFIYQADVAGRISQLKQAGITPSEALNRAETDINWSKTTGRKIAAAFNKVGRLSLKVLPQLAISLEPILNEELTGLAEICLSELRVALEDASGSNKTLPLSQFKKKWLSSEEGNLYFKPYDQLKKLVALSELYDLYEKELRKRKLYDYDDMILYALEKLENNKEFLSLVQETYQFILADEYQDTNAAQARIITLIAANPVNEDRPNVMVVGDDDQAIYGFQGAMGNALLHFRERWRDVTTITLKDNYRSTQHIIDTARSLIMRGQNRLEDYYEDIDKSLRANANHPSVEPVVFEAASPQAVLEKAVSSSRSVDSTNQLAIIATKHKYLRELADSLDKAKINYYYEGREDLLNDPSVSKTLLLAEAALAIKQKKFNRTSYVLPEIIAGNLLGLSRPEAWEIAIKSKQENISWWEALNNLGLANTKSAASGLQQAAKTIDDHDSLESLRAIAKQYHLKALGRIKDLVEHSKTYYLRDNISLGELLSYAKLCQQAGINLSQKVIKGNQKAQVLLLTAHKSKGLEFDRVYLLHADYHTWIKEKGRRNNLTLPEGWNSIEPAAETLDDKLRLLYVVMTRAKKELGLIRSGASQTENSSLDLPGLDNLNVVKHVSQQLEAFEFKPEQPWQGWYMPQNPKEQSRLKELLQPVLKTYRLSPSHLTTFLDVPHGGPAMFLAGNILGIPEPAHLEAIFGSLVHKCLNYAQQGLSTTGKLPKADELSAFVKGQATTLNDEQINDIVSTVSEFIRHSQILKPGGIGEYSFSKQNLVLNDAHLTGVADHFVKQTKKLVVTDFKTGRALNSWRVTEDYYKHKLYRFRQQLLFYELLFKLSPEFTDVNSMELKIAFVEPSRRDIYYELTLDADSKERNRLQNLIQAVWQKINQVNFPDTTVYSPDFRGVISFEDDLINDKI